MSSAGLSKSRKAAHATAMEEMEKPLLSTPTQELSLTPVTQSWLTDAHSSVKRSGPNSTAHHTNPVFRSEGESSQVDRGSHGPLNPVAVNNTTSEYSTTTNNAPEVQDWVQVDSEIPIPENATELTEHWAKDWDIECTMFHMQHRKWFRVQRGIRDDTKQQKTKNARSHACTLSLGIIVGGMIAFLVLSLFMEDSPILDNEDYSVLVMGFIVFPAICICLAAFAIIRVFLTFRLVFIVTLVVIFAIIVIPKWRLTILTLGLSFNILSVTVFVFKEFLKRTRTWTIGLNSIVCVYASSDEAIFEIRPPTLFFLRKKYRVKVKAKHRVSGKPHGSCEWIDGSYGGECVIGIFDHGFPIGPFRSLEPSTGNMYESIRVGYCTSRESMLKKESSLPPENDIPLSYGIVSVEACVTGKFYNDFPIVGVLKAPAPCLHSRRWTDTDNRSLAACSCVARMEDDMLQLKDNTQKSSITINAGVNGLNVTGYLPRDPAKGSDRLEVVNEIDPELGNILTLDGSWRSAAEKGKEALVLIHGFNTSTEGGFKKIGQLLTLGSYPNYIKPFLFSWRAGSVFCYPAARKHSTSLEVRSDFASFMGALRVAGYHGVHLMTHSMGGRVLGAIAEDLFYNFTPLSEIAKTPGGRHQGLRLYTATMMNPEIPYDHFQAIYPELARYCDCVTVYADQRDSAVKLSQKIFKEKAIGQSQIRERRSSFDSGSPQHVDIDIIDCTFLDNNLDGAAHSFFDVNRLMIDDLNQIVLERKRADQRNVRLAKVKNGLYTFVSAPTYVKN